MTPPLLLPLAESIQAIHVLSRAAEYAEFLLLVDDKTYVVLSGPLPHSVLCSLLCSRVLTALSHSYALSHTLQHAHPLLHTRRHLVKQLADEAVTIRFALKPFQELVRAWRLHVPNQHHDHQHHDHYDHHHHLRQSSSELSAWMESHLLHLRTHVLESRVTE